VTLVERGVLLAQLGLRSLPGAWPLKQPSLQEDVFNPPAPYPSLLREKQGESSNGVEQACFLVRVKLWPGLQAAAIRSLPRCLWSGTRLNLHLLGELHFRYIVQASLNTAQGRWDVMLKSTPQDQPALSECTVHCVTVCYPWLHAQALCVVFCPCSLLVGRGRMRSHPSPANSHQSGPMLEPQREEAIAHSTGAHSPSTQGGQGHLTHQGPVYFSCYH
ncbi:hypothetical protein JOQ06_027990, partial [Pogonophryne albipinna]